MFWSQKNIKIKTWCKHIFRNPLPLCIFGWIIVIKIVSKEFQFVRKIDRLFNLASEITEADNLHLFLLSDGNWIDDNKYLESLENGTELIVCKEEQIQKLLTYFELKRYLSLKSILYPLDINCFLWYSKLTLMFIEAVQSLVLFSGLFNGLYIWLWTSEKSSKRIRSR